MSWFTFTNTKKKERVIMDTVRVTMPKYFRVSLLKNNVKGEKESKKPHCSNHFSRG